MGNPKQKWTAEEEDALRRGIDKYGPGKWKFIQRDPEFNKHLYSRSNIDLKDKWRNMSAAAGQGPREKSRGAPKPRNTDSTVTPNVSCLTSAPDVPVAQDLHADLVKDDLSKDPKNGPKYNAMVMEALSTTKERYGMDITSLMSYIEQRVEEVPQNFRKLLGSRLRRLVAREELEKIENCYRIKPVVKDTHPKRPELISLVNVAVQTLVKGEELSFKVAEATKEAEKIAKMAEEADDVLQLANEIYESCSRGETVRIA